MRYMRVRISTRILLDLLTEGKEVHARCIRGLPKGAKFCYSIPSTDYICIDFVFEHPDFEVIPMGHSIPIFPDPIFEKI